MPLRWRIYSGQAIDAPGVVLPLVLGQILGPFPGGPLKQLRPLSPILVDRHAEIAGIRNPGAVNSNDRPQPDVIGKAGTERLELRMSRFDDFTSAMQTSEVATTLARPTTAQGSGQFFSTQASSRRLTSVMTALVTSSGVSGMACLRDVF